MIRLSKRLLAAASLVRGGGRLADIGTDHAYLPLYLIENGIIDSAIASDIGAGPLANAKKTLDAYGASEKIELRLSNGLNGFLPDETDEIVICGMGGNLIEDILSAAPWVCRPDMHLVLQPMTHSEDVRRYLCQNGFEICNELCIADNGRVYLALDAVWKDLKNNMPPGYYYFGSLIGRSGPAEKYVRSQFDWVCTRLNALQQARRYPEEQTMLQSVRQYYYGVKNENS